MPKVPSVTSKYVVSFNGTYDGEYGDSDMRTADWEGNDVTELSSEVIASEPTYPLHFKYNTDGDKNILGWFYSTDVESPDAIMMLTDYFYG